MKLFLPELLNGEYGLKHHFVYHNAVKLDYKTQRLKILIF